MDKKVMDLRQMNWVAVFEAQAKSGLSKCEFCRQNDIPEGAFFRWQNKLRKQLIREQESLQNTKPVPAAIQQSNESTPAFFEISPAKITSPDTEFSIDSLDYDYPPEINIPPTVSIGYEKFSIKLSGAVSPAVLSTVLKAVKNA